MHPPPKTAKPSTAALNQIEEDDAALNRICVELESEPCPCPESTLLTPFVKGAVDKVMPTTLRKASHITAKFGKKPISTPVDSELTRSFMRKEVAQSLKGPFQQRDRTVTLGDGARTSATEESNTGVVTIGGKKRCTTPFFFCFWM